MCIFVGAASPTVPEDISFDSELQRLIHRYGLDRRVVMTGYKDNVADYVNVCELLIHASVAPEPFGRVLLEAMAQSKPVIACRAGGVEEIVIHGQTGLLYEPGNPHELARCIAVLYGDAALRRSLGLAGYHRLEEKFSIERNVRATMALYESILS